MKNNEHIETTAYLYGRNCELRKRTITDCPEYREYDALCMALWRELISLDATNDFGWNINQLKEAYRQAMEAGRDSVSEY